MLILGMAHSSLAMISQPLLVLDPYLIANPAHRRSALDSRGGASINAQSNVANEQTRPQTYGISANMPFVRDPDSVQSGWGLGLAAFLSKAHSSSSLKSYNAQVFEISTGRNTIVPSLEESVGLQGFFEFGFNMDSLSFDDPSTPTNVSIPSPRRSLFLRFGAMSLSEGKGLVNFKPYMIDQSLTSSFQFPIDIGETVMSFAHTAQIGCLWNQLKCGTTFSYTHFSETLRIAGFAEPAHWLDYGLTIAFYTKSRNAILRTRLVWDSVKTSRDEWVNGQGKPTFSTEVSLVF